MAAIKGPAVFLVSFCATYSHFADLGLCRCANSQRGSTRHGYRPSRDLEQTDDPITAISQVASEENGLTLRVYASDGALKMEPGESELS